MLNLDSVHLMGGGGVPPCIPGGNSAFAVYQFAVNDCGTTVQEEDDYVVYENRMFSTYEVAHGPYGSITRDSVFELSFKCRYFGSELVSLVAEVGTVPPPLPVSVLGPLNVELRLANGQCDAKGCSDANVYSSFYRDADYPVVKVLREPLYVEVRILERTDPNIVLTLEHCWATSTSRRDSMPQWSLIVDGCPYYDDRYMTTLVPVDGSSGLLYPTHYKRFIVSMFTFVDSTSLVPLRDTVFIHCSVAVCHPSSTTSCEQRCYTKQKRSISSEGTGSPEETAVISSREVILMNPEPPTTNERQGEGVPQSLSYGLLAGGALVVFAVFALALTVAWRTRHHKDSNACTL
ncbi:hypothetical protein AGOR_G00235950 [Albula goreensis]|uniref:ZP domain-containing protein n=1 Tax=Albula goreensis TaxID=1534307 RepID=A0A8T3CIK6_9TELE|nr:hypothetical protein AGOR_G00235950 [Albula goreensis]